ncbi:Voltage-dependent calcium channel gamma-5 subunit [Liparis tanakae]|uniref:Voltage-dependent calcium channel gamma-5 subunit n=1 Tax=Liparis tanakae TaxID=230148 RepID=A0A4Z2F678_9TELE|nr:Voltage-dependent calcium channel gamma-5 subunit [Liparis tanakae]
MSLCGRKALTLVSSVFAVCALGLLGIAVSTDYWLYLEEGVILPLNQSTEVRMSLHSGLWRVCFLAVADFYSVVPKAPWIDRILFDLHL